jgi:hypothetical protein
MPTFRAMPGTWRKLRQLTIAMFAVGLAVVLLSAANAAGGSTRHSRSAGAGAGAGAGPGSAKKKKKHRPKVLRVGTFKHKHGKYATLQEALAVAQEGDWILIGPGDYKQSASQYVGAGAFGDIRAGSDVVVRTPNLHIRGMNRNTVVLDGTKPGTPQCSSNEADQYLGASEGGGHSGNNGVVVYKTSGVWLQNFTACNFVNGNLGGGNEIWFDGGQASGKQEIGSWWGEYLSATSTYWGGTSKPQATYGVYASNTYGGPGVFEHTYASNMSDSGLYIGACPDCKTLINHSQYEGNDLGYSGSNSGGHLTIENSEFNNNEEGVATTSQNNDDAPSPQEGLCPGGKENPAPPAGAQRKNICWVMIHNRIIENNNGGTPTSGGAPGLLGTGMTDGGGRNDLIVENTFAGNKAWGILVLTYPGIEESPPSQVLEAFPEDECRGGTPAKVGTKSECVYEPWANEVEGNKFSGNGGFGNATNGDIGEVANPEPKALTNCWHSNVEEGGGEPSSEPAAIQTTHGTCSNPDAGSGGTATLAAQAACDSRIQPELSECTEIPGSKYPRTAVKLLSVARMNERSPTMPDPCIEVPKNAWCPKP